MYKIKILFDLNGFKEKSEQLLITVFLYLKLLAYFLQIDRIGKML